MNLEPTFSVIIPTFNRESSIKRAIESVQAQSWRKFEIIVVNDGSTDSTKDLLEEVVGIRVINQKNHGVSHARNRGVEIAKADWICFLDSDDEWLPQKLECQAKYIEENPRVQCIHTEEIWIRNGLRVNQMKKHKKGGGDQFLSSLKLCLISPSSVCLHRNLLSEFGGFREDYMVCEDYDLWLKVTAKYDIGFIDRPLVKKFGGHEDQLSRKFFAMDYWRIKSLDWILRHGNLEEEKQLQTMLVLKKKSKILIRGYLKHNNLKDLPEIQEISDFWDTRS